MLRKSYLKINIRLFVSSKEIHEQEREFFLFIFIFSAQTTHQRGATYHKTEIVRVCTRSPLLFDIQMWCIQGKHNTMVSFSAVQKKK